MASVSCPHCGAYFEVDFEPGTEFTCGDCHGIVTVPAAPVVQPRASRPAPARPKARPPQPAAPAPKGRPSAPAAKGRRPAPRPGARKPATGAVPVARSAAQHGASHAAKKPLNKGVVIGCALGAVALVTVLIMVLNSSGPDESKEKSKSSAAGSAKGGGSKRRSSDPYVDARQAAVNERTVAAYTAFGDLAWTRWETAKKASKRVAARQHEKDFRWAYGRIVEKEPDHALAHERLGNVLFDLEEARKLESAKDLSNDLRSEIGDGIMEMSEAYPKKHRHMWLSKKKDDGKRWAALVDQARRERGEATARANDPFTATAQKAGQRIVRDLAGSTDPDFRREGITGDPCVIHVHKPYILVVQRDRAGQEERIARRWFDVLSQLQQAFYSAYEEGTGIDEMIKPTPVLILRDSEEYAKFVRRFDKFAPIVSGGHYNPGSGMLVCYMQTEDQERTTLFHEGTHQLVDWGMRRCMPAIKQRQALWFSEGIADYFGGHGRAPDGNGFVPGLLDEAKIKTLADAKKRGDIFKLPDLLDYSRTKYIADRDSPFARRKVGIAYAQGWGLCYFLQKWLDGKYEKKFIEYLAQELKGRSGQRAFTSVFGNDLATIEREFHEMIDTLEKARKDKKIVNGKLTN